MGACLGHDKVHLCRSLQCGEEGQHFKEYALAKEFDAEKFQLRGAELGAAEAGKTLWTWFWAAKASPPAKRVFNFGSESEPEEAVKCAGHQVRWSDNDQDHVLCRGPCGSSGANPYTLLEEDAVKDCSVVALCPKHALDYEKKRRCNGCRFSGCQRLGVEDSNGIWVCKLHGASRRSSSRKRSPARTVALPEGGDPEEPELPPPRDDGHRALRDLRQIFGRCQGRGRQGDETSFKVSREHPEVKHSAELGEARFVGFPQSPGAFAFVGGFLSTVCRGPRPWTFGGGGSAKPGFRAVADFDTGDHGTSSGSASRTSSRTTRPQQIHSSLATARGSGFICTVFGPDYSCFLGGCRTGRVREVLCFDTTDHTLEDQQPGHLRPGRPEGRGSRAAGQMDDIARAIQSQTAEIASLVKNHTDANAVPAGAVKGLKRASEELVFLLRACDQYQVTIGAGEQGQALANALLSAQVGASTRLRKAGFKQKVTTRLAVGLAGPYWGTQEKHALMVADFVARADAELDAFVQELRTNRPGHDQRPAPPNKIEDWEARVRRQNDVWSLVYGAEWKPVRSHALSLLLDWHQAEPHKWPLSVVSEIWEELHWRFFEELKEIRQTVRPCRCRTSSSTPSYRMWRARLGWNCPALSI